MRGRRRLMRSARADGAAPPACTARRAPPPRPAVPAQRACTLFDPSTHLRASGLRRRLAAMSSRTCGQGPSVCAQEAIQCWVGRGGGPAAVQPSLHDDCRRSTPGTSNHPPTTAAPGRSPHRTLGVAVAVRARKGTSGSASRTRYSVRYCRQQEGEAVQGRCSSGRERRSLLASRRWPPARSPARHRLPSTLSAPVQHPSTRFTPATHLRPEVEPPLADAVRLVHRHQRQALGERALARRGGRVGRVGGRVRLDSPSGCRRPQCSQRASAAAADGGGDGGSRGGRRRKAAAAAAAGAHHGVSQRAQAVQGHSRQLRSDVYELVHACDLWDEGTRRGLGRREPMWLQHRSLRQRCAGQRTLPSSALPNPADRRRTPPHPATHPP